VFDASLIREVVQGIEERGVLAKCDGVLSGYMGSADTGAAILDAVDRVKAANPKARYCCDPVIGDVGRGVFVRPGIPEFMREHAVPAADIVTPNQFELDHLTGLTSRTMEEAVHACGAIHAMGPTTVLVTSLHVEDTPKDAIDLLASGREGRFRVRTPRLDLSVNGAGDAIAALFFAHCLRTGSTAEALSLAASSIVGLMRRTAEAGSREIVLVDAQEEYVKPSQVFRAEPVV
jgi:pyridoxine kinase